ncbi:hypothetical protein JCM11251_004833 [Rhodosporidiobolus azoricus]
MASKLDPVWHIHFAEDHLLIIPETDFVVFTNDYVNSLEGPFVYTAFIEALPPHLHPSVLKYQVIALKPDDMPDLSIQGKNRGLPFVCGQDGIFRQCETALPLPPRTFFRVPSNEIPNLSLNPLLPLINASHKLLKVTISAWPPSHDSLFLGILNAFAAIFSRLHHDPKLYCTAIETAAYLVALNKPKNPAYNPHERIRSTYEEQEQEQEQQQRQ